MTEKNNLAGAHGEQEALWYLGGRRMVDALVEQGGGAPPVTEFVTPAGTLVYAHLHKEDEAFYAVDGEATVACSGQRFHLSAGTFLFLPCKIPHHMEVSTSGPFRYLTWMVPADFAQDVTKMGNSGVPLLLAPPHPSEPTKIQQLADLLRKSPAFIPLQDLRLPCW